MSSKPTFEQAVSIAATNAESGVARSTLVNQLMEVGYDQAEANQVLDAAYAKLQRDAADARAFSQGVRAESGGGAFAPERAALNAGVLGGVGMMALAAIWFVVGLAAGYIFYYPPILFVIGIFGVIKGLATGNIAGRT